LRVLRYLEATQEAEGRWAQNLWLDGQPYWSGIQMDETALPIGTRVDFTFYWTEVDKWEGKDFEVLVAPKETGTSGTHPD
jgi:hypothetical protein